MNQTTTYHRFEKDILFCKNLKSLFISSLVLTCLSVVGIILTIVGALVGASISNSNPDAIPIGVSVGGAIGIAISVPCIITTFIINLIYAIRLLSHQFEHEDLNQQKIIWGIFTIIILGMIAMMIWTVVSKNILNQSNQNLKQISQNSEATNKTSEINTNL